MAKAQRSAHSRLIDNIGRRIRHLRDDLAVAVDDLRKVGIERNMKKLIDFRDKLKELAKKNDNKKLTDEQIYEATEELKTNDNYTTSKEKIDQVTLKKVFINKEKLIEETQIPPAELSELDELFADFAEVSGKYIGQSDTSTYKSKALNLIEAANLYKTKNELTDAQVSILNQMVKNLDDAIAGKGKDGVVQPIDKEKKKKER